jgi:hypothetical protein
MLARGLVVFRSARNGAQPSYSMTPFPFPPKFARPWAALSLSLSAGNLDTELDEGPKYPWFKKSDRRREQIHSAGGQLVFLMMRCAVSGRDRSVDSERDRTPKPPQFPLRKNLRNFRSTDVENRPRAPTYL